MLRYAITIFLSAFLLFLVQPLIGKYILPWFGGGPGVWTTCMLFFQVLLLGGYAYAHLSIRWLKPRVQIIVHVALLLIALAFLPIVPDEAWKPVDAGDPTARILLLLAACIGGPYLILSATGPLLQAWFNRTHAGVSPYRLYALSNIGSLLALVCYPFIMEPNTTRYMQAALWSGGFVLFALACGYCAVRARGEDNVVQAAPSPRQPKKSSAIAQIIDRNTKLDWVLWILLPACASIMLLAVTNQFGEEITPVPFLWVLPLAVYLLSFIIAFEWPKLYNRAVFGAGILLAPWLVLFLLHNMNIGIRPQVLTYLSVLFFVCMVCHGELFRIRPPAQRLTSYYLAISAGGALGGLFVSLVAPLIFNRYHEFYIGLYGSPVLLLICFFRDPASLFSEGKNRAGWLGFVALCLLAAFLIRREISKSSTEVALRARNFYGVLTIKVQPSLDGQSQFRKLEHGRISHGAQFIHNTQLEVRLVPTTYFAANTGVGMLLESFPKPASWRVGVVGLGVGTLAAYGRSGDHFRFYEINPQVAEIAEEHFYYLSDSRSRKVTVDVVMGDARLSMEREDPQKYDILILDAFSGDAIPIHLLTKEAFDVYLKHLAEGGVIAVHVSNRYVDLFPVVHRLALNIGFQTVFVLSDLDNKNFVPEAHWVLVTANKQVLEMKKIKAHGLLPPGFPDVSLWTDDKASLFEVLR